MADIARAIQFAADAIYANDQFSASQASLAAELAVRMLDEAELLGGTLVGVRERRISGQPAAGVKCPECGQVTDERGGCACASETVWAKGPDWKGLAASLFDALQFECVHGDPECTCIADHAAHVIAAYEAALIDGFGERWETGLMGKYLFPQLTDELSAVVSTHGYFEIQRRESYNSYTSGVGPVYRAGKTSPDGTKIRLPDPVVVYSGVVSELGITYENDDIYFEGDDAEDDGREVIRQKLLAYLAAHNDGSQHGEE